jgi:predicted small lipoprotein YifL
MTAAMNSLRWVAGALLVVLGSLLLGGCGLKDDLYRPVDAAPEAPAETESEDQSEAGED